MADAMRCSKRKTSKIIQWYDTMHRLQETKAIDQAINIAIAGLVIVTTFTVAAQFIVKRPTVSYLESNNCTPAVMINETHGQNRVLHKVTSALADACDEYNDVNIGTQVFINNKSAGLNIFYLCEYQYAYENAIVIKKGTNKGKCQESYSNVTKTKLRSFPVVVKNTRTGKSKTFYTLKDSCAIHSAMERLDCTW